MGDNKTKKETKDKNFYEKVRATVDLSQENVSEMSGVSVEKISKLENGGLISPEDIISLNENAYKEACMYEYYCANNCPIGKKRGLPSSKDIVKDDMGLIMLELLHYIGEVKKIDTQRIIELARDGVISEDERKDYDHMKEILENISKYYLRLSLWEKSDR